MTTNIATRLRDGKACRGAWLSIPSAHSARLLARLPLDFLLIDAEHTPLDNSTLHGMVSNIAEANGPAPVVRVAAAQEVEVKRALDAGAQGIIAPMVNTPEEAKQVVAWSKFPPKGRRSFGSAYAGLAFGQTMQEYLRYANEQTFVGIQIEHNIALGHLDAIFSTPNLDMAFVGPVDLSISLGLEPLPENPHPLFQEVLRGILRCATKHGLPLGIYCSNADAARQRLAEGFLFVNVASDASAMLAGVKQALSE
ncbi:MAG: HpcH/HpaI aldolase family protein [Saprospiraceae bacterium]